eukprot:336207-Hanusia_phi.AAC.2
MFHHENLRSNSLVSEHFCFSYKNIENSQMIAASMLNREDTERGLQESKPDISDASSHKLFNTSQCPRSFHCKTLSGALLTLMQASYQLSSIALYPLTVSPPRQSSQEAFCGFFIILFPPEKSG